MSTLADTALGKELHKGTSHLIWVGIALLVVGVVALVFPMVATLLVTLFVGWLLIISGVLTLSVAFSTRGDHPFFGALLLSLLSIATGVFIIARPGLGAIAITIALGAMFMVQGAFEAVFAFEVRPARGWSWMLVSAIASIVLSLIILSGLPAISLVTLGILIGVNFISSGVAYLLVGGAVKRVAKV
jgi:uncharacterized membrane protein HdeD (DUF308 family)